MGRVCCFAFAIAFTIIAMVALVVASATDYWFEVKNISDSNGGGAVGGSDGDLPRTVTALGSNDTIELENRRFQYPYHVGLWLTCYDEKVPDTGETEKGELPIERSFVLLKLHILALKTPKSLLVKA